jgi:hypothetical protein
MTEKPGPRASPGFAFFAAFFLAANSSMCAAKAAAPELRTVSVESAITHLEQRLKASSKVPSKASSKKAPKKAANPSDGSSPKASSRTDLLLSLARLHVLAFTHPEEKVSVSKRSGEIYRWPYATGVEHLHPIEKPRGKREHLKRAEALYALVLKREPKNLIGRIGLAWTHDQSGKHQEARREYRAIYAECRAKIGKAGREDLTTFDVGAEAATTLITLLDQTRDAAEIRRVQDGLERFYDEQSKYRIKSK